MDVLRREQALAALLPEVFRCDRLVGSNRRADARSTGPEARSEPSGRFEDKVIVIYGPPGVGKSTLASEFGDVFFFDTEGGLSDLSVFKATRSS